MAVVRSEPVAGLLFDMGDVLYDATVWRRWLLQLLSRMGLHTHYRPFYRIWEREFLHDVQCGRCDYWEALRVFLRSAGLSAAQIDEIEAAGHARYADMEDGARPLPGVPGTLAQLAGRNVPMGVLANACCGAEKLKDKLAQLRLADHFVTVVSSFDLGCVMPQARCYQAALDAMSLSAEQAAFVGHDSIELAGAAAVGMTTVAFNYDPETQADVYLDRFDQLLQAAPYRSGRMLAG